jgi:MSHA biogenesis protein MshN
MGMSLINQMLRDLESRQQAPDAVTVMPAAVRVVDEYPGEKARWPLYSSLGVLILIAAGGVWYYLDSRPARVMSHVGANSFAQSAAAVNEIVPVAKVSDTGGHEPDQPQSASASGETAAPSMPAAVGADSSAQEAQRANEFAPTGEVSAVPAAPSSLPPREEDASRTVSSKVEVSTQVVTPAEVSAQVVTPAGIAGVQGPRMAEVDHVSVPRVPAIHAGISAREKTSGQVNPSPPREVGQRRGVEKPGERQPTRRPVPATGTMSEESAASLYRRALGAFEEGRNARAATDLERVLALQPDHRQARLALARAYAGLGDYSRALALLDERPEPYGDPETARLKAQLLLKQGRPEQAEQALGAVPSNATEEPEWLGVQAAVKQRQGKHAEAVELYRKATSRQPEEMKWWLGLAISLEAGERYEEARAAYHHIAVHGVASPEIKAYVLQRLTALRGGQ